MITFCTTCSAAKREDPDPLPAIERYLDRRIREVESRAKAADAGFLILSGEYGLLKPEDPIPWYDHLLQPDEVAALIPRAEEQLRANETTSVYFFTIDPATDPYVQPYLDVITGACDRVGIELAIIPI